MTRQQMLDALKLRADDSLSQSVADALWSAADLIIIGMTPLSHSDVDQSGWQVDSHWRGSVELWLAAVDASDDLWPLLQSLHTTPVFFSLDPNALLDQTGTLGALRASGYRTEIDNAATLFHVLTLTVDSAMMRRTADDPLQPDALFAHVTPDLGLAHEPEYDPITDAARAIRTAEAQA
ncbi:hypothetical protein [Magnetofaba australis]|uniref:Uncharacterized protein n=1 Tax=Magnetofaba australis IT-1 TaxID=1434232 RepID=A0A1Y2K118_9PROT|nr:hypothetical protein [Magnetofaba australis]OSM01662.1 hypothetical protein MAIT1_01680 [Magnetofaba australis IT-1]